MTAPSDGDFPDLATDIPSAARMYDHALGGKDNFAVDRAASVFVNTHFPESLHAARTNRLFLYRAVRFLARDAGIRQYLDLGSGLPTQHNVHQVAQQFQPDARVVYVDNDPIVLSHGRALLASDDSTTVIAADMTELEKIVANPDTRRLLDLSAPMAALFLSVGHFIVDDATLQRMFDTVWEAVVPGSYLAFSQLVGVDQQALDDMDEKLGKDLPGPWRNRLAPAIVGFLRRWEPVDPGLVDVISWRPDPDQPPLPPVEESLQPFLTGAPKERRFFEFGGVVRKPGVS